MLFEAMPLSLRSDKRKGALCREDLPLSKKLALDRQPAATKYGHSRLMGFSSSAEKLVLPNLAHESVKPDNVDIQLALNLSSDDEDGDLWTLKQTKARHENGIGKNLPAVESAMDQTLVNNECNDRKDVLLYNSPGGKVGSPSKGDFQRDNNGSRLSLSAKQPAIILDDHLKKSKERKKSGYDRRLAESASNSLIGGYMRRMASLNASACVSAMMEPEKKGRLDKSKLYGVNSNETQLIEARKSWSISSSDDLSAGIPSPIVDLEDLEPTRAKELSLSPARFYGSSASSDADTSKDSDDILNVSDPNLLLAIATLASATPYILDELAFNKLGLLYNGDTIHPAARVFFTSDTDLSLPDRIIPRVVPSQEKFLKRSISKAMTQRLVGKKRKGAKVS